jgi:bacteriocin-like protein
MKKLIFDLNSLLVSKAKDKQEALPVEKELNEQELATVSGGWGGGNCWGGCCGGGDWWWQHRHRWHHWGGGGW